MLNELKECSKIEKLKKQRRQVIYRNNCRVLLSDKQRMIIWDPENRLKSQEEYVKKLFTEEYRSEMKTEDLSSLSKI